jgi:acyl-CoA thioester hydrolase
MQVAYHAHYLAWFEIGRTELLRELGCTYASLEDLDGIRLPLREVGVKYHAPARYDDLLEIHTVLRSMGGASLRFEYRVLDRALGRLLATGFTEHVAVGENGRPRRLPEELRRRLTTRAVRS